MSDCCGGKCDCDKQRFCLVKDEDGHDYLIPWEMRSKFDELSESEDAWEKFECEFGNMRTGIHPSCISFAEPKEEG